jgi:hypothetical protein
MHASDVWDWKKYSKISGLRRLYAEHWQWIDRDSWFSKNCSLYMKRRQSLSPMIGALEPVAWTLWYTGWHWAKLGKYTIGVILVNSPVSFAYFAEYLAISKEDCKISLVSFDTNEYTIAPPWASPGHPRWRIQLPAKTALAICVKLWQVECSVKRGGWSKLREGYVELNVDV